MQNRLLLLALVMVLTMATGTASGAEHQDRIDLGVEHQTIDNFAASDCWVIQLLDDWPMEQKERLAELLFSRETGLGLSCWRFTLGGGVNDRISLPARTAETFEVEAGEYDWSQQATEQWFLRKAKEYGVEKLLAFVNSPPGRMTYSGHTFNPGPESTNLREGMEGQFAAYICDILEHFAQEGLFFDYISPINEPQIGWDGPRQEGNRSDNETIKRVIRALDAEMDRRGLDTQMAVIECSGAGNMFSPNRGLSRRYDAEYGNYIEVLAGDPEIRPMLDGRISYHAYGSNRLGNGLIENRRRLTEAIAPYPDVELWMSEYCVLSGPNGESGSGRDYTMEYALWVTRIMHVDLTMANVTAWQWWIALSHYDHRDGLIYTDYVNEGDPQNIIIPKMFYAFANYSRYVRPGMVRVELAGPGHSVEGLMGSAYLDDADKKLAAVYVNVVDEPQTVHLDIEQSGRNWSLESITSYTTSDAEGDDLRPEAHDPQTTTFEIPARSVVTLVLQYE